MAIAATMVWEVRGAGSDANGGGFDPSVASPGTDFSVQDAAQVTYTDLVVDGADNTLITSAAFPFGTTHPGNVLHIDTTGGGAAWTTGWYEVLSVTGVKAKLDRSPAAVGSTAGTGKLGGGFASPGQAASVHVAKNTIYVKRQAADAVYGFTDNANVAGGSISLNNAGDQTALTQMIGYDTNRVAYNTDSPPTVKPTANSFHAILKMNANYLRIHNFKITNPDTRTAANTAMVELWGVYNLASRISADMNLATGWFSTYYTNANETYFFNCVGNHAGSGITTFYNNGNTVVAYVNCSALNGTANFNGGTGAARFYKCLAYNLTGAATDGFNLGSTAGSHYYRCVAYGCGRDGFSLYSDSHCVDCISVNNGRYGFSDIAIGNPAITQLLNPATFGNVTAGIRSGDFFAYNLAGAITLTADPFTNAAGLDFSLTAAGKTALAGFGNPVSWFGLSTVSAPTVGMVDAAAVAAVTGTYITLTSNVNPSSPGQSVTFTAAVTVVGGAGPATGTIQFAIDGVAFDTAVTLVNGSATSIATTTLTAGTRTITAVYTPVGAFRASTGTLSQVVYKTLPVGSLFRKDWSQDKEGFAQELAHLFNQDPILAPSVNVVRTVLPQVL